LAAEPGPHFRWGTITRRSTYNKKKVVDEATGEEKIVLTEESTSRQEDTIFTHVEKYGLGRIVAVYSEVASAYDERTKRGEYENALEDLRAGRIDGIIVWKLDRLTRRRSQARRLLVLLEECGGRLYSIVEGIDTADPSKKDVTEIILSVYIGQAQAESESISERVRLMHFDKARKGMVQQGGERPFGHTREGWRALVPHEVKILKEAGGRVLADEAPFSIARDLTRRKVPTTRGGTVWSPEVLFKILRSPRMVGMRSYGGELYPLNDVPPIFDQETWERICAKLERRPAGPSELHLLSTIALCGNCLLHVISGGRPYNGARARVEGEFTYRCARRGKGREDGHCGGLTIVGMLADEEVNTRVVAWLSRRQNVRNLLERYADRDRLAEVQARTNELTESLANLSKALSPPLGVPRMPLETYYARAAEIEEERRQLQRQLAVTREAGMLAELLEVEDIEAEWETRLLQWRRAILKLVTLTIVIEPRGKGADGGRPHERRFDPTRIKIQFAE